ncbi:MAG: winged helix-turn-helix domain-containing protein [Sphingomicrobium sp.]
MDQAVSLEAQRIELAAEPSFALGPVWVDPSAHEITIAGAAQRMQPQTLKVLVALNDRVGKVVTRQELIDRCWDGRIVGEDVINRCISLLRRFAVEAGGFRIETVPRAGYRLVTGNETKKRSNARWPVALAVGVAAASVVAGLMFVGRASDQTGVTPTIQLLPFTADGSQSPAAEVAAAARQALAGALSDQGFAVRTTTAVNNLGQDFAIRGNVIRAAGAVQATVSVEQGKQPLTLLTLQFDAPAAQAGALPTQVGAQVATAVSFTNALNGVNRRPVDPAVTSELMRQMTLLATGEEPLLAYPVAVRIARREPNSPLAQLLLAMSTGQVLGDIPLEQRAVALKAGRRAADLAHALAPEFGMTAIPWCLLNSPVRMKECEDHLRGGLRADPDSPLLAVNLSEQLAAVGRSDEALQFARVGVARERYLPKDIARLLRSLEATGHPGEAERIYAQARKWWPNYGWFFWSRLGGMLEWGDVGRLAAFESGPDGRRFLSGFETPTLLTALRTSDRQIVERECRETPDPSVRIVLCMLGLARLGDLNGAYRIADQLYPRLVGRTPAEEQELWLRQWEGPPYQYLMGRAAEPLRRDPRFVALAERTGLLAYWRSGRLPDFCTARHEMVCAKFKNVRSSS